MARKNSKIKGIIEKAPGVWWIDCYVNGKRFRKMAGSKTAALNFYQKIKTEEREGRLFPEKYERRKGILIKDLIDSYLEGSTNRGIQNEKHFGKYWKLLIGKIEISKITTDYMRRVQSKMASVEKLIKGQRKRRAPGTINRHFAFLRHVFSVAVTDGKLTRNPISGIKFFPESSRTRFLSDNEIKGLKNVMSPEDWKVVAFALNTGLRREEQFSLRWDQIDFDNRIITIPLPKGGKTRHIPLNDEAMNILRTQESIFTSPWVFPKQDETLKPRSAQGFVNSCYTPALHKAGIVGACWHTLRHTAASKLVMVGVDLLTVKEILGHRDIDTTLRYSHLAPGHIHEAINKIGIRTDTKTDKLEFEKVNHDIKECSEQSEIIGENNWLGDEESNLDRQIQKLSSCR